MFQKQKAFVFLSIDFCVINTRYLKRLSTIRPVLRLGRLAVNIFLYNGTIESSVCTCNAQTLLLLNDI